MTKISMCEACEIVAGRGHGRLILLCDHASNRIPEEYVGLGLEAAQFERHIAYDIGAAAEPMREPALALEESAAAAPAEGQPAS